MATTTDRSAFDSAPAFIKANGIIVYRGTVAALRQESQVSGHLGIAVWHALLDCVDDWCCDRRPTEPRPLCMIRRVVNWTSFTIDVGVGDA